MRETSDSTLTDVRPVAAGPRPTRWRTVALAVMAVVVAAGAAGLLGVRSATGTATAQGYTLTVTHAAVARAGLDVPWRVEVRRPGGFSGPVTLAVTADYFDLYESQGLDPEPAAETSDGQRLYWTFDPPPGDVLAVDFDAYIQPSSQWGASGEVTLLVGGAPVVSTPFTTWLVP
ncbi:MAG: hypothetical protein AB7G09_23305 [Pseudonocardia sp.]